MSAYALLWQLIKHVLHGRGRDEVYLHVQTDEPCPSVLSGELEDFEWAGSPDAFCVLSATSVDGLL